MPLSLYVFSIDGDEITSSASGEFTNEARTAIEVLRQHCTLSKVSSSLSD